MQVHVSPTLSSAILQEIFSVWLQHVWSACEQKTINLYYQMFIRAFEHLGKCGIQSPTNLRVHQHRRGSWPDTVSLQRTFWSGDVMRSRIAGRFPRWQLRGAGALPRQSAETMHFWHSEDSSLAQCSQLSHPNLVTRSAWNVILNP